MHNACFSNGNIANQKLGTIPPDSLPPDGQHEREAGSIWLGCTDTPGSEVGRCLCKRDFQIEI